MLDKRSVQTVSTPFDIFKYKENVESMLIESLNQFKFHATRFQQAFDNFLCFQQCWFNNCVERMLKQMLKAFRRA